MQPQAAWKVSQGKALQVSWGLGKFDSPGVRGRERPPTSRYPPSKSHNTMNVWVSK